MNATLTFWVKTDSLVNHGRAAGRWPWFHLHLGPCGRKHLSRNKESCLDQREDCLELGFPKPPKPQAPKAPVSGVVNTMTLQLLNVSKTKTDRKTREIKVFYSQTNSFKRTSCVNRWYMYKSKFPANSLIRTYWKTRRNAVYLQQAHSWTLKETEDLNVRDPTGHKKAGAQKIP